VADFQKKENLVLSLQRVITSKTSQFPVSLPVFAIIAAWL
jgi:hypothetical protein